MDVSEKKQRPSKKNGLDALKYLDYNANGIFEEDQNVLDFTEEDDYFNGIAENGKHGTFHGEVGHGRHTMMMDISGASIDESFDYSKGDISVHTEHHGANGMDLSELYQPAHVNNLDFSSDGDLVNATHYSNYREVPDADFLASFDSGDQNQSEDFDDEYPSYDDELDSRSQLVTDDDGEDDEDYDREDSYETDSYGSDRASYGSRSSEEEFQEEVDAQVAAQKRAEERDWNDFAEQYRSHDKNYLDE